jgi:hypothetical protein
MYCKNQTLRYSSRAAQRRGLQDKCHSEPALADGIFAVGLRQQPLVESRAWGRGHRDDLTQRRRKPGTQLWTVARLTVADRQSSCAADDRSWRPSAILFPVEAQLKLPDIAAFDVNLRFIAGSPYSPYA